MEMPPAHSVQLQWRSNSRSVAGLVGAQEQNPHLIRSPTGQKQRLGGAGMIVPAPPPAPPEDHTCTLTPPPAATVTNQKLIRQNGYQHALKWLDYAYKLPYM